MGTHDVQKVDGPGVVTGRSGTLGKVNFVPEGFWPLNTSLWVKDFHGNEPRWVARLLANMHLERFSRGSGVPTLNRNLVHVVKVNVPPLDEQRRIAAILDKADAIRRKRREAIALTEELLRSTFLEMFGDPVTNPKGFPRRSIGSFCKTGSGGTPSRKKLARYYGGSIPWVKSGELREEVVLSTGESITDAALAESSVKWIPAKALLVAMYGATVGRVAMLGIPATSNQAVCHIVPDASVALPEFMFEALQAQVPHWLEQRVGGAQPNISQSIVKETQMPVPSLDEQDRFARTAERIKRSKAACVVAADEADNLFHSLVQRAFRGEL